MVTKKRRPGGGRKATLHKVATFSTRITAETRAALEAEAVKSGLSISQLAEKLISAGLQGRHYRNFVSDPVRALALVIENLERESKSSAVDGTNCEWNTDPTVFETFRLAIAKVLEQLRPAGEIDSSVDGPLVGRSPEEQAEAIFRRVWAALLSTDPLSRSQVAELFNQRGFGSLPPELVAAISRSWDSAEDVRKALNIKPDRRQEK